MKEVLFTLPVEYLGEATDALLLGDFNNWKLEDAIKLTRDGNILTASVSLGEGRSYEYRYLLSNGQWVNGVASEYIFKPEFGIENCIIHIPVQETVISTETAPENIIPEKPVKKLRFGKKQAETNLTEVTDDLELIEGVGPEIKMLLLAAGINTFKDLSKASARKLKNILKEGGNEFSIHDPKSWPKQAKLAATGKWEDFKAYQQELKAGK